jgi:clathrin heavy chain
LFSIDRQWNRALDSHVASFSSFQFLGNETPSFLIAFAAKSINDCQLTSKLHVPKLDAQAGKPIFSKKHVDIFFPLDLGDGFLITM